MAEQIPLTLRSALGKQPSRTRKEQEFIVAMQKSWEERRIETLAEGRAEGRLEGRAEGQANAVLTVLRTRGIAVPEAARKRILAERDLQRLERWLKKASTAASIAEVIGDRSAKTARPAAHRERGGRKPARVAAQR